MDGIGWLFVLLGGVFTALSLPMALGKVPPNHLYGFRTPKTLSRPEIWYPANRAMGVDGTIAGVFTTIACAAVTLAFRRHPLVVVFACLAILLVAQAVVLIRGFVALRRL